MEIADQNLLSPQPQPERCGCRPKSPSVLDPVDPTPSLTMSSTPSSGAALRTATPTLCSVTTLSHNPYSFGFVASAHSVTALSPCTLPSPLTTTTTTTQSSKMEQQPQILINDCPAPLCDQASEPYGTIDELCSGDKTRQKEKGKLEVDRTDHHPEERDGEAQGEEEEGEEDGRSGGLSFEDSNYFSSNHSLAGSSHPDSSIATTSASVFSTHESAIGSICNDETLDIAAKVDWLYLKAIHCPHLSKTIATECKKVFARLSVDDFRKGQLALVNHIHMADRVPLRKRKDLSQRHERLSNILFVSHLYWNGILQDPQILVILNRMVQKALNVTLPAEAIFTIQTACKLLLSVYLQLDQHHAEKVDVILFHLLSAATHFSKGLFLTVVNLTCFREKQIHAQSLS